MHARRIQKKNKHLFFNNSSTLHILYLTIAIEIMNKEEENLKHLNVKSRQIE